MLAHSRYNRNLTFTLVFFFLISAFIPGLSPGAEKSSKAPDFTALDLEGQKVEMSTLLQKGPVLISFWATHCKPCIKELSKLQKDYPEYRERGFEILAVDVDGPRSVSRVKSKVKGLKWEFPVLFDTNREIYRKYHVLGIPHTVLIDPQGEIRYTHTTYRSGDEKTIWEKVNEILAEKKETTKKEGKESGE